MKSTGRFTNELRALNARSYDKCQTCGLSLPREVAAYTGYSAQGSPLYVGDCCKAEIEELASHIYWWWEVDKRCEPQTRLWRYMDFAKFVLLLDQRALYFARADVLGDAFEGASGIAERQPIWDAYYLEYFRNAVRTVPGQTEPVPEEHVEREAARLLSNIKAVVQHERRETFVSCWHANTGESEALWRLYCPPNTMGVAIETDAERLMAAIGDDAGVKLGRVQYVDFREKFAGFHDRIFWKRKSLSHEAEVRAVLKSHDAGERRGMPLPIDLERLCIYIVPSPFAPEWFAALVESTLERFGVTVAVSRSELLNEPFF